MVASSFLLTEKSTNTPTGQSQPTSAMDKLRKALSGKDMTEGEDEERGNIITQVCYATFILLFV